MNSMLRRRLLMMGAAMLFLTGCSSSPYRPDVGLGASVFGNEVDEALRYHRYIRTLPSAELNKEFERVSQAFAQSKADLARIELVLLLTAPNTSFRDDGAALNLLKEWLQGSKPPEHGLRALGGMLEITIEETREADKRADSLRKKLDALKTMEKSLIEREKR